MTERGGISLRASHATLMPRVNVGEGSRRVNGFFLRNVNGVRRRSFSFLQTLNRLVQDGHQGFSLPRRKRKENSPENKSQQTSLQESTFFEKSVVSAMDTMHSVQEVLEDIKRKAALEAIKRQMQLSRQSVKTDGRLSSEARHIALLRVDRLEKRLLAREAIRWRGPSILRKIQLAAAGS